MEEEFSVKDASCSDSGSSVASKLLANLPSRGFLSTSIPSSHLGRMRVYVCEHETSPPENQVIKTDQVNILIRALTLKKQKSEGKAAASAEGSRKRLSEGAGDGRGSTKKAAMTSSSQTGSSRDGSESARDNYSRVTVEKLRALLKEKGLSTKGKKDELIARLRSAK